jgi:hypothetical protein
MVSPLWYSGVALSKVPEDRSSRAVLSSAGSASSIGPTRRRHSRRRVRGSFRRVPRTCVTWHRLNRPREKVAEAMGYFEMACMLLEQGR